MDVVHSTLAYAAVAAVLFGTAWTAVLVVQRRPGGRLFARYQVLVVGLVILAAVAGAVRLVFNSHPADNLHLLYGVVAVAALPVARSFLAGKEPRDSVLMLVAFVVLAGVLFRLFSTG